MWLICTLFRPTNPLFLLLLLPQQLLLYFFLHSIDIRRWSTKHAVSFDCDTSHSGHYLPDSVVFIAQWHGWLGEHRQLNHSTKWFRPSAL